MNALKSLASDLLSHAIGHPPVSTVLHFASNPLIWAKYSIVMVGMMIIGILNGPVTAYAADLSGSNYDGYDVRHIQNVITGTIQDARTVTVQNNSNTSIQYGSAAVGGIVGGLLGQSVGQGNTRAIATALLTTVGGVAGYQLNQKLAEEKGIEFIVSLDDGRTIAITQGLDLDAASINVGDRVRLIMGSSVRVARINNESASR